LRVRKDVPLLSKGRSVRRPAVRLRPLVIFAQIRVERALAVRGPVRSAQTTRRVGDVSVAAAAIVDVHDRLRMDSRQIVRWTLLQKNERACKRNKN